MEPTRAASAAPKAEGRATGALLPDELRIGPARLVVTDIERTAAFHREVLGLTRHDDVDGTARLGTPDGTVVLELVERPDARPAGRHAGLYHVALLYPSREELARVIERIAATGTAIDGASDHGTHEAIYLPDPDGNGLELAVDRPREQWPDLGDIEEIRPRPLDVHSLLEAVSGADDVPQHAQDGLIVGHLHLHVGDVAAATEFWTRTVGFEVVTSLPVAAFLSAGGYHHHLAVNSWRGEDVGPAPADAVGLAHWSVELPSARDVDELAERLSHAGADHERHDDGTLAVRDPWGIELRVRAAQGARA